jgi:guanylate kinase
MAASATGNLVVFSGPSGVGKTTVLGRLFERAAVPLVASVSATTREPRPGEKDGINYHFLSPEEFAALRRRGEFIECFQVFGSGHWYGTLKSQVTPGLESGKWVVLEIDVKGALAVVKQYPHAITIFIGPASLDELEKRLRGRGTESEESVRRRLRQAQEEMSLADRYRFRIVNDEIDRAVDEICDILSMVQKGVRHRCRNGRAPSEGWSGASHNGA